MAIMTHRTSSSSTVHTFRGLPSARPSTSSDVSELLLPPPTCNTLDAAQRSRLIKSTRKLGKMLGATPLVLEADQFSTPKSSCDTITPGRAASSSVDLTYAPNARKAATPLTRSRSLSHASTSSAGASVSASSDADAESTRAFIPTAYSQSSIGHSMDREALVVPRIERRASPSPQQPVLRLPMVPTHGHSYSVPSPSSPLHATFTSPSTSSSPSPLSPVMPATPVSPLTPSGASSTSLAALSEADEDGDLGLDLDYGGAADEARIRKRRMDKLMRHLGERVPSELVFGKTTTHTQMPHGSMRRPSTAPAPPSLSVSPPPPFQSQYSSQATSRETKQLRRTSVSIVSGPAPASLSRSGSGMGLYRAANAHTTSQVRTVDFVDAAPEKAEVKHLVDDEWTPAAYQDVVRRLRALK